MKAVILAGGYGSRLNGTASGCPKPLVPIGDGPLLWHVIRLMGCQGVDECIIALGFAAEKIRRHFLASSVFEVVSGTEPDSGEVVVSVYEPFHGTIRLVETGLETQTGGRIKRLENYLASEEAFLLTYADGLADIDVQALMKFHRTHGRLATVTAVHPPERFGRLELDQDRVAAFKEKTPAPDEWINGGFFVLHPEVLSRIDGDATSFEEEPLHRLAVEGQLMGYRHEGFWACMDTPKEKAYLNNLWKKTNPPWKLW